MTSGHESIPGLLAIILEVASAVNRRDTAFQHEFAGRAFASIAAPSDATARPSPTGVFWRKLLVLRDGGRIESGVHADQGFRPHWSSTDNGVT